MNKTGSIYLKLNAYRNEARHDCIVIIIFHTKYIVCDSMWE